MGNIGLMNERLTYTGISSVVSDGIGGSVTTPGTSVETWCKARQVSQKESISLGLDLTEATYMFTVRYEQGVNINTDSTLTYKSRSFRVMTPPRVINENDRFYEILAAERRV